MAGCDPVTLYIELTELRLLGAVQPCGHCRYNQSLSPRTKAPYACICSGSGEVYFYRSFQGDAHLVFRLPLPDALKARAQLGHWPGEPLAASG